MTSRVNVMTRLSSKPYRLVTTLFDATVESNTMVLNMWGYMLPANDYNLLHAKFILFVLSKICVTLLTLLDHKIHNI